MSSARSKFPRTLFLTEMASMYNISAHSEFLVMKRGGGKPRFSFCPGRQAHKSVITCKIPIALLRLALRAIYMIYRESGFQD